MATVLYVSGAIVFAAYIAAYLWRVRSQKVRDVVGTVFGLALLVFVDSLLYQETRVSFFSLALSGSPIPYVVFVAGGVLGMAYEYIWQFGLKWWHYPYVEKKRILLVLLPVFWGFFMLIMQDTYALLRLAGFDVLLAATVTALVQGVLIEGINIFTRSWVYTGPGASLFILIPGWVLLLGFVFVPLFNQFVINPFGY